MMKYHFRIHKERKGYWAEGIELPGCVTQGDSLTMLKDNLHEALDLYLEEAPASEIVHPLPKQRVRGRNIAEIEVSPGIAFAVYLRAIRQMMGLTQREAAKRLGFRSLYSY